MTRSKLFANHENKFKISSKEEIKATAFESAGVLFEQFEGYDNSVGMVAAMMITGIKIGVLSDGVINSDEKTLIEEIFGEIWNRDMSELYDMIGTEISDNDYNTVESIIKMGNHIAIPYLYFILSFAYIDGVIEDEVVEKLDDLFKMIFESENLLRALYEDITLTDFENEIVEWFQQEDTIVSLEDIFSHFSNITKTEVKKTMDSLFEKGVMYCNVAEDAWFYIYDSI